MYHHPRAFCIDSEAEKKSPLCVGIWSTESKHTAFLHFQRYQHVTRNFVGHVKSSFPVREFSLIQLVTSLLGAMHLRPLLPRKFHTSHGCGQPLRIWSMSSRSPWHTTQLIWLDRPHLHLFTLVSTLSCIASQANTSALWGALIFHSHFHEIASVDHCSCRMIDRADLMEKRPDVSSFQYRLSASCSPKTSKEAIFWRISGGSTSLRGPHLHPVLGSQ
ncbi:hypothetical protein Cgig2_018165 [Carnegiea gigantea]|uniref:Uncharacterized protein n=1 Tax=Carnegiea gigantea TaxID=171969 RepID=A0A9Q1QS18_9CARY|nr:hypothetical protein Cgig2_018165 [Carnegiea gigantea]